MHEEWLALNEVSHFQHDYSSKTRGSEKNQIEKIQAVSKICLVPLQVSFTPDVIALHPFCST